jgi:acetylornithine aminotransferase
VIVDGLRTGLAGVAGVKDIRGMGLMLGVELDRPCGDIVRRGLEAGLVANVTADKVVRLLPPLIIDDAEARQIAALVSSTIKSFLSETPAAAAA